MPKYQFITLLLCLNANIFFGQTLDVDHFKDKNWEHHKTKNGIEIYTHIPKDKKLKELYLKYEIECSMSTLLAALEDIEAQNSWVYKCNKSYVLNYINEREFVYYIDSNFPIPAMDRDIVIHYRRELPDKNGIVTTSSIGIDHSHIEDENNIRISDFSSNYEIEPITEELMSVKYYMAADPAGSLPAWLINLAVSNGPVKTINNLRDKVKQKKYKG